MKVIVLKKFLCLALLFVFCFSTSLLAFGQVIDASKQESKSVETSDNEDAELYVYFLSLLEKQKMPKEKQYNFNKNTYMQDINVMELYRLTTIDERIGMQKWLNQVYGMYDDYKALEVDGKFSMGMLSIFIFALQKEIGVEATSQLDEKTMNVLADIGDEYIQKNKNITTLIQYALTLKGYKISEHSLGSFNEETKEAILSLKQDAGFIDETTAELNIKWIIAIFNTKLYRLATNGTKEIRTAQQVLNYVYSDEFGIIGTDGRYTQEMQDAILFSLEYEADDENNEYICPQVSQRVKENHVKTLKRICKVISSVDPRVEKAVNIIFRPILSDIFGFEYDEIKDIYYTREDALQKFFGFGDTYDRLGPLLGMNIEEAPIVFQYVDKNTGIKKECLLELWKGEYASGLSTGAEIGVYNRVVKEGMTPYIPGKVNSSVFFKSALGLDKLHLHYDLFDKNQKLIFTRDSSDYPKPKGEPQDKDWWLLGMRLGEFHPKHDLIMKCKIKFLSSSMANKFVKAVKGQFANEISEVSRKKREVSLTWKTCEDDN